LIGLPVTSNLPTVSFQSGCEWSSVNYSCAYDAVFMSFFVIYKSQDSAGQNEMKAMLDVYGKLGTSLQLLNGCFLPTTTMFNVF